VGLGISETKAESSLQAVWRMEGTGTRVPGLPISNCAGSCNNLMPRGAKVSAIDVTQKVFFECLY